MQIVQSDGTFLQVPLFVFMRVAPAKTLEVGFYYPPYVLKDSVLFLPTTTSRISTLSQDSFLSFFGCL